MALSTYHLFDFVIMLHKQQKNVEAESGNGARQRRVAAPKTEGGECWGGGRGRALELVLHAICIGQCSHRVSGGVGFICDANHSYQFEAAKKRLTCATQQGGQRGQEKGQKTSLGLCTF